MHFIDLISGGVATGYLIRPLRGRLPSDFSPQIRRDVMSDLIKLTFGEW